jgi:hypothetical protein
MSVSMPILMVSLETCACRGALAKAQTVQAAIAMAFSFMMSSSSKF